MDTESDRSKVVGQACTGVGVALVGVAVEIISRVQPVLWWAILLLAIGSLTLVVGLLVLIVPPPTWMRVGYDLRYGFRFRIREWCEWKRYGPNWSVSKPSISSHIIAGGIEYTATFSLWVKNRDKFPIQVNYGSVRINLEQQLERKRVRTSLSLAATDVPFVKEIERLAEETLPISLVGRMRDYPDGKNEWPDVNGDWGIQEIYVTLSTKYPLRREIHKGIYHASGRPLGHSLV